MIAWPSIAELLRHMSAAVSCMIVLTVGSLNGQVFRCTKNTAAAVLERPSAKRRKGGEGLETAQPGTAAAPSSPSASVHEAVARSPSGLASAAVEAVMITDAREPDGANVGSGVGQQAGTAARIEVAGVAAATYVKGSKPRGLPEKLGDRPLRLILVGHNPSDHAWCAQPKGQRAARLAWHACRKMCMRCPSEMGCDQWQQPLELTVERPVCWSARASATQNVVV